MTIQVITPLPTPVPSRLDPVNFATRADAFLTSLPTFGDELNDFASEANALALDVQNNKNSVDATYVDMQDLETTMQGIYSNSVATGNFKGIWSNLTGSLVKPATVFNAGSYWILLENLTDVTTSEPSVSNTDWLLFNTRASDIVYENTESSLTANNAQEAIDEVYDYASGYLGNGSAVNVSDSAKKTAREWLGIGNFGFKNRLINADFSISQEFGYSSIGIVAGAAPKYVVDQWYATSAGANVSAQLINGISDNVFSLRLTGATSNTAVVLGQRIESFNCYDLGNKQITVSLKAKSTSNKTIAWNVYYANTPDVFATKTLVATGTINVTTSVERFSFNFNAGSNAGNGLAIEFYIPNLLSGSTIDFDSVQLENSAIATEFEKRAIQYSLFLCQRYYEIGIVGYNGGYQATGSSFTPYANFVVPKRATPTTTITISSSSNVNNVAIQAQSENSFRYGGNAITTGTVVLVGTYRAHARL